jgi:hypothetical protein
MAAPDQTSLKHHTRFYMPNDLVTIQVEDCLFRVSRAHLCTHSAFFADMFTLPHNAEDAEGRSDDTPLHMDGVPIAEFEAFMELIYAAEFKLDSQPRKRTPEMWMTCIAAVMRWDATELRSSLLKSIGECADPILQLQVARRFELQNWIWPILFALCMRTSPLSRDQLVALAQYPDDLFKVTTLRETLAQVHDEHPNPIQKEIYLRKAMWKQFRFEEPLKSEIKPPRSGFRRWVRDEEHFPDSIEGPSFKDVDDTDVYLGTCKSGSDRIPGKVRMEGRAASWPEGDERGTSDEYDILPIDTDRMEWVPATNGRVPDGRDPVLGGWENSAGGTLYHAYGTVDGVDVPGKTNEDLGAAMLPFGGTEHRLEHGYFILVWKVI